MTTTASAPATSSLRGVVLVCPRCRGPLSAAGDSVRCENCGHVFGSQEGILDLRVFPDPYLSEQEDRERTEKVLEALDELPLPDLLKYYWSLSDITPASLREQFTRGALFGEEKARRVLGLLDAGSPRATALRVLEIGSGTGGFLTVAAPHFDLVVGTDIAMRWLHLSRRRFRDAGQPTPVLVCCCAEHLPFPDGSFDLVVMTATLEFTREPERVLAEAARMVKTGGAVFLNTVNRYSLAPEPHVNLWGVGLLPRAWQDRYVRWRRDVGYTNIRPLSYPELRRLAAGHFSSCDVAPGDVPDAVVEGLPARKRVQVRLYRFLKRIPPFTLLLKWFGPEWDVKLGKAS